ncbi:MAG: CFI-box-CTERM domain-containing protein [Clostridia bacterium]
MSYLECKSCGGELDKDGNVYICRQCGEVFKDEHAVSHGNVSVKSKAKKFDTNFSADKLERLNNLYTVARRAKDNNDDAQAEKYYDMILVEDPNSWEAAYYTTYFHVAQCKIGEISSAAYKLSNCLNSVFDLIDNYTTSEEESNAFVQVYTKTEDFAQLLYINAQNHYQRFKDTRGVESDFVENCKALYLLLFELGDQLEKRYIEHPEVGTMCAKAWEKGIDIRINYKFTSEESKKEILSYVDKIKKYNPSYQGLTFSSGGCYVATCVYGSYDCPEVWTLRRYRDYILAETWYGRAFIRTYYAISPTIVKWFGNTIWFKKFWRGKLDKMVKKLREQGIENTSYEDRMW